MKSKQVLFLFGMLVLLSSCSEKKSDSNQAKVDLIIYNAKVTTLDAENPSATAVSISNGKITSVGISDEILKLKTDSTIIIDADGRRLIPGLNDSHSHFLRAGTSFTRELRWDGVPSLKIGLEMIKKQAAITPKGEWVRVIGGWTPWQFEEKRLPTPEELTAIAPETPVYIQYFYSAAIMNKKALESLAINSSVQDPMGGKIVRDKQGNPTGLFLATPHPKIFYSYIDNLPKASLEVQKNSTIIMFNELVKYGLTSVIDAGGGGFEYPGGYEASIQLAKEGKLATRVSFLLFSQHPGKELEDYTKWTTENKIGENFDDHKDHGFELDGGGEYVLWKAGDFENFRSARFELDADMEEKMEPILTLMIKKRWPFRIHSTYNESITRLLNVIEKVNKETPLNGLRWSIEHAETLKEENIDRIKILGGGVAVQDRMVFLGDDYLERYGKDAAASSPPIKMLLKKGVPVGMGTDATRGSSFNPWVGIHWLVTGKTAAGQIHLSSENLLTREEAIMVYSLGSAWFSQEEDVKGKIKPGQLADVVLLTQDVMTIPEDDIKKIQSALTVVNGKIVYASDYYNQYRTVAPEIQPEWSPLKTFGSYYYEPK